MLKIGHLSNYSLRLAVSTQYSKLPKIIIDTMEFEFVVRRLAGKGYSRYFSTMQYEDLISLALNDNRLKRIMPNHADIFKDRKYLRNLLDMFIKVEIQNRHDIELLKTGTSRSFELSEDEQGLNEFMNRHLAVDVGHINVYRFNLNSIRQSIRLREKKEVRRERELNDLRAAELELRKKKVEDRTQRCNKKIRRKLRIRTRKIEHEVAEHEPIMNNTISDDKIVDPTSVQNNNGNSHQHIQ